METTLIVSHSRFLKVGSQLSELHVIICRSYVQKPISFHDVNTFLGCLKSFVFSPFKKNLLYSKKQMVLPPLPSGAGRYTDTYRIPLPQFYFALSRKSTHSSMPATTSAPISPRQISEKPGLALTQNIRLFYAVQHCIYSR